MSLFKMIGAMSGTSMDGLDLVLCEIHPRSDGAYDYKVLKSKTYAYPDQLLHLLQQSKLLTSETLFSLDKSLGNYFADCILKFIESSQLKDSDITAIASHGHTVFHQPQKGFTVQIGCGITIAAKTGIRVINDFRQKDVISGGQGAPLVPLGDALLFKDAADAFLNIGGFTNISIIGPSISAFDICPGNLPLNEAMQTINQNYDLGGNTARRGKLNPKVLEKLNALPFYHQRPPKSLGTEWLEAEFMSILNEIEQLEDRLHTAVIHIADQIAQVYHQRGIKKLFVTGGGAKNDFLMEQLHSRSVTMVLPSTQVIDFKEALVFAFLGVRYLEGKHNCLASVTGARKNVCGGTLHLP